MPLALITRPVSPPLETSDGITATGAKATPFNVSFTNTVVVLPPAAPNGVPVKLSFTASISGFTTIMAVAVSQFVGLATSQI